MPTMRPLVAATPAAPARLTLLLVSMLLLVLLMGCGAPAVITTTRTVGISGDAIAGGTAAISTTTAVAGGSPGTLQTVGGAAPELAAATAETWRSQAGSLLAADASAWRTLSRPERRILLDGEVAWAAYDDLAAAAPDLPDIAFPVVYFAAELRPHDEIRTNDIFLNQVVLDLPAPKLESALAAGEPQAVNIGPDVIILVDDVVVGLIEDGAGSEFDAPRGTVDQLGRIVVPAPGAAVPASTAPAPAGATDPATTPRRIAASGEAIERAPLAELPIEAAATIALIQAGGPFPFERDGITFGNYEEHLPAAPFGHYREYTVITPGLDHRGARRIVAGNDGTELYYTHDHYESFVEVVLPDD